MVGKVGEVFFLASNLIVGQLGSKWFKDKT